MLFKKVVKVKYSSVAIFALVVWFPYFFSFIFRGKVSIFWVHDKLKELYLDCHDIYSKSNLGRVVTYNKTTHPWNNVSRQIRNNMNSGDKVKPLCLHYQNTIGTTTGRVVAYYEVLPLMKPHDSLTTGSCEAK